VKVSRLFVSGAIGALAIAFSSAAAAQTTINSTRASHVTATGTVNSRTGNANTFTGQTLAGGPGSLTEFRSFIEFAVPASATDFTAATLRLNVQSVIDGPNDLTIYDFSSSITSAAGTDIYNDAGTGAVLGTITGLNTTGQTVDITLNTAGLAAVNAARGGNVAFGLVASPLVAQTDGVFGASTNTTLRQLVLTAAAPPAPVPTLSEWAMIILSLTLAGGAVLCLQRRRMTA
jgi:hypothetical protein